VIKEDIDHSKLTDTKEEISQENVPYTEVISIPVSFFNDVMGSVSCEVCPIPPAASLGSSGTSGGSNCCSIRFGEYLNITVLFSDCTVAKDEQYVSDETVQKCQYLYHVSCPIGITSSNDKQRTLMEGVLPVTYVGDSSVSASFDVTAASMEITTHSSPSSPKSADYSHTSHQPTVSLQYEISAYLTGITKVHNVLGLSGDEEYTTSTGTSGGGNSIETSTRNARQQAILDIVHPKKIR